MISRVSFPSVFLSLLREIEAVLERPFSALIDPVAPKRKSSESIPVPDVDQYSVLSEEAKPEGVTEIDRV